MRMWMIPPVYMCKTHLVAEHGEIHKLCGSIENRNLGSVRGLVKRGYVDLRKIEERHKVIEEYQGYNSPIKNFDAVKEIIEKEFSSDLIYAGPIDINRSIKDLKVKRKKYDWCTCLTGIL